MSHALSVGRLQCVSALLGVALVGLPGGVFAQMPVWSAPSYGGYPANASGPSGSWMGLSSLAAIGQRTNVAAYSAHATGTQPGPLARLVHNPHTANGSPPFALTDQYGTIQRLVEPVPGINLEPYVGQVVVVRHDTGSTLLATQLELPSPPQGGLWPMVGEAPLLREAGPSGDGGPTAPSVQTAMYDAATNGSLLSVGYVDDDDATVELIDEAEISTEEPDPDAAGEAVAPQIYGWPMGAAAMNPDVLTFGPGMVPYEGGIPVNGPQVVGPMYGPPQPGGMVMEGMAPCPHCGGYHAAQGPGPVFVGPQPQPQTPKTEQRQKPEPRAYGEAQVNFIRLHLMEESVGKLSEKYEFSPRFVVGLDNIGGFSAFGGRLRYWTYGRHTQVLSGGSVRFEFDVVDAEVTHRIQAGPSNLMLGAGLRWAGIDLEDRDDDGTGSDMLGATMAIDGQTPLFGFPVGTLSWVYGGRLSILGGDWVGSNNNDFVEGRVRDDNVVVEEIYAGIQFSSCYRGTDLHARAGFEMQNWHSDALSDEADTDSIGFLGPGISVGARY